MPPPPPLLALLLAPLLAAAEAPDPARAWAVWHWGGAASLEAAQVQALRAAGCDRVWRWVALIEAGPRRSRRGGALAGAGELPWEACVRVDAACTPLLERDGGASLWPLITAEPGAAGLQIDWDVPVRLLPQYAGWLSGLRRRLPPGTPLACTALLSWLDAPGFAAVAAAVDLVVPQCYALGPPAADAEALVGGADLAAVARRLGALGRPHRLGLAAYEQTVVTAADGTLRTVAAPVAAEDLLAAGLRWDGARSGGERILSLRAAGACAAGPLRLLAGDRVRCAQPTAAGLARSAAAVRAAAGPGFRGLAVFRLPAPGDLPAFAPLRLARALSGAAPAPARLAATLERQAEGWAVVLANPGDEDLVEPAATALAGGGPAPGWTPPGGLVVEPAAQGRPCSPARADGCRIALRFLRAGARLAIPLQGAAPTLLPCD